MAGSDASGIISSQREPLLVDSEASASRFVGENDALARGAEEGGRDTDGDVRSAPGKLGDESAGLFIWTLTFSAGISGLLFGCEYCIFRFLRDDIFTDASKTEISNRCVIDDTGVISATLVSIGTALSNRALTSLDKSIITSCTSLFALLISPYASVLADSLGRKRVILAADILFVLGAVIQALSSTIFAMVIGRSIVGAAVGAASFVVPLYIAELSPASFRGRLVTMNIVFITLGQVIAYVVGWVFGSYASERTGWRWMVGLGALPAAIQMFMLLFMPESPRWLVKAGRSGEARAVIQKVAGGGQSDSSPRLVDATLKNIEIEVREEEAARRLSSRRTGHGSPAWLESMHELFAVRRNRRALAIACLLQGLQQLCGFVCGLMLLPLVCPYYYLTHSLMFVFPPLEFSHVLFGYHFHPRRVPDTYTYVTGRCRHQFRIYSDSLGAD